MDEFVKKKNNLTLTSVDRRKSEIWTPIAKDLGVTWQSVDAMYWALGKGELARRAQELNSYSKQSGSSEEIARSEPEFSNSASGTQELQNDRARHFNATRPPQVHPPMPLILQPIKSTAGQTTLPRLSTVGLRPLASSMTGENGEEGKRQVSPRSFHGGR